MVAVIMRKQNAIARSAVKDGFRKFFVCHNVFVIIIRQICTKINDNTVFSCADFRCTAANLMTAPINGNFVLHCVHEICLLIFMISCPAFCKDTYMSLT